MARFAGGAVVALAAGTLVMAVAGAWPAATVGGSSPDTARVGPEAPVTATDRVLRSAFNSPMLVADPTDSTFVVAAHRLDAPEFGCGLQLSGNGGRGWVPALPVPTLPEGAKTCYNPEVAFDRLGRLYFLFVGLAGKGNRPMGAFLTFSDDRASTFSPPRAVLGPNRFGVRMAIDRAEARGRRGRIHLAWIAAGADPVFGGFAVGDNPILSAHSDDGGTTFSEPGQVNGPARRRVVAPALAVGPGGALHVAYYDLGDDARDYQGLPGPVWAGRWTLVVRTSAKGDGRFGKESVVDDQVAPPERVMLVFTMPPAAIAVAAERSCLAWTDARAGDPDVLSRCRTGLSGRWEPPRRLNDDPPGSGRHQYLPRLAASPDGRIDAAFYDRRADLHNRLNEVAYTFSRDGGRTFAPNVRVSSEQSNPRIGARYAGAAAAGQVEIGGRLGLLSSPSGAVVAWADTRNSDPAGSGQDVFAASLNGLGGRSAPGSPKLLAVALVCVAVFLAWPGLRRGAGPVSGGPSPP